MENNETQQVVQAVNLPDAATDSLTLSKLVTFVLLMIWLGLTASAFYLRSFVSLLSFPFSFFRAFDDVVFFSFSLSANTESLATRRRGICILQTSWQQ